jgi:hypothetical protein
MPRFVILHHELPPDHGRPTHWDLMLEDGPVLRTWALDESPRLDRCITGIALPDHRLDYLEYEGPVSGDRGQVTRWDHGEFVWRLRDASEVIVELRGERLKAQVRLARGPAAQRWRFFASALVDSANRD